jgi:hypothetical protein
MCEAPDSAKAAMAEYYLCQGLEKLIPLGGFIEEVARESILDLYDEATAEAAEKYDCFGPGMWQILTTAHQAYLSRTTGDGLEEYDLLVTDEKGRNFEIDGERFAGWEAGQNVRCGMLIQKEGHFWDRWNCEKKIKRTLAKLSPVQERVLYLSLKLENTDRREAVNISTLPEFEGAKLYVMREFDDAGNIIKPLTEGEDNIYEMLRKYNKNNAKENDGNGKDGITL